MDSRRKRQVLETPKINILKYHLVLKFPVISLIIARIAVKCSNRLLAGTRGTRVLSLANYSIYIIY
jgi:hypothetical protein